jgi:flavin reductase (DIM6/NTAB) family NADH-FMN oxidoreductase RutF
VSEPRKLRRGSGVDQTSFRHAVGQFASGIVVVTTGSGHAMTVSAFSSVSLDPPLVLFCAEKVARFHDAVLEAGSWAVSILAEDAEKTARWLATRGRPLDSQLDGLPWHPAPVTGAPVLHHALATLECTTTAVHNAGDHSIVVGQVVAVSPPSDPRAPFDARIPSDARGPFDSCAPSGARGPSDARGPLLHYAGRYRRLRP